jgi:hypothetical protein
MWRVCKASVNLRKAVSIEPSSSPSTAFKSSLDFHTRQLIQGIILWPAR